MKTNPIIIALDVETAAQARELVTRLGDSVSFYKVGMELYASAGMDYARELIGLGKQVFLDLKFFDIPETVKRATAVVARVGVRFLTVHSSFAVMRAAIEGRSGSGLEILAVTVLTSFEQADVVDLGFNGSVAELVALRVRKANEAGVDGLVCSPLDVRTVRQLSGPRTILVTPGVRSAGTEKGDQKRVATPAEAIRDGSNYLVIGRQVTRAADPQTEVKRILAEIQSPHT